MMSKESLKKILNNISSYLMHNSFTIRELEIASKLKDLYDNLVIISQDNKKLKIFLESGYRVMFETIMLENVQENISTYGITFNEYVDYLNIEVLAIINGYTSLINLNLSVRAHNCLNRENIFFIETLEKISLSDLLKIKNLGLKCALEIVEKLDKYNKGV